VADWPMLLSGAKRRGWWKHRKSEEFWQFYRQNYSGLPEKSTPLA